MILIQNKRIFICIGMMDDQRLSSIAHLNISDHHVSSLRTSIELTFGRFNTELIRSWFQAGLILNEDFSKNWLLVWLLAGMLGVAVGSACRGLPLRPFGWNRIGFGKAGIFNGGGERYRTGRFDCAIVNPIDTKNELRQNEARREKYVQCLLSLTIVKRMKKAEKKQSRFK